MNLLKKFLLFSDSFHQKEKMRLASFISILFLILFSILALFELFNSIINVLTYSICTLIPTLFYFYLKKTGKYQIVYLFYCILGTIIAFVTLNFLNTEIHFGEFLWMVLIIILAFWGLNNYYGFLFLCLNIFSIVFYMAFSIQINFESLREINTSYRFTLGIETSVALICISFILYQFVSFYKFSIKKMDLVNNKLNITNSEINQKNNENILLLKEVHHRVKNNLQIIISLLRLQKQSVKPEDEQKFDDSINRIMSMALIHRKLYQFETLSNLVIESYLKDLVDEISNTYSAAEITTKINSSYDKIGFNTLVPLGLMLNELISNSIKHAFDNQKEPEISISIQKINETFFEFVYSDNGSWKDKKTESFNFGEELITTLTEQLEGTFTRIDSKYCFKLKNLDL